MSEAFIPPTPATPAQEVTVEGFGTGTVPELEEHLRSLRDQLEGTKSELKTARRELELAPLGRPLVEAIEYIVERRIERWIDSEYGRELLGRVLKDLQGSSIDDAVQLALSNATVDVEAYIRP